MKKYAYHSVTHGYYMVSSQKKLVLQNGNCCSTWGYFVVLLPLNKRTTVRLGINPMALLQFLRIFIFCLIIFLFALFLLLFLYNTPGLKIVYFPLDLWFWLCSDFMCFTVSWLFLRCRGEIKSRIYFPIIPISPTLVFSTLHH